MKTKSPLPRVTLTAKQIEHMLDPAIRTEVPAGPPKGLYLVVQTTGAKSWALRYRWQGKSRKLTLGTYSKEFGLAAARGEAQSKFDDLAEGRDPAGVQAEENAIQDPGSVEAIADEWIARHLKVNVEWPDAIRILKNNIVKPWKHKRITDISRADVLRVIDSVVDRGAAVQANRTLSVLRAWLNWCVERGILPVSPATGVKPPTTETSRDRVLSADELHEIWTTSEAIGYPNGGFLRFLILTAQRRGEVATMRWQDVDLDKEVWTLPKESTKAGRVHDVPLSTAALDILKALPRFKYVGDDGKEHDGEFVWTSTSGRKPINGFSKLKARVDKETLKRRKAEAEKAGRDTGQIKNLAEWTLHDVRRTAATGMAKAGVPPHVLSALLNHTPGSAMGVTSIYNRFRYTEERRAALQAWAEFVLRLEAKKEEGAA